MTSPLLEKLKSIKALLEAGTQKIAAGTNDEGMDTSNSVGRALLGSVSAVGDYYLPPGLFGGCCPRVVGEEEGIVWNAAAESADTERVHVVWQAQGEKIWYLAVRSTELAENPDTWCPFASLLPGMKDSIEPPVLYTYFTDESATMMTVLIDGLQIHRGTSSVIRAKAERAARELNGAPVIELIPDRISKLVPSPWYSLSLFEERARRVLATFSVLGAVSFGALSVIIWLVAALATVSAHADLNEIRARTDEKSLQLLKAVQEQRASPMREQLARFADVNDGLLALNGYLEIYVIDNNLPTWRAVLPSNVTSDRIRELGGQTLDATDQGVVIGNSKAALDLGKSDKGRK